jgi:hypothetical protein
VSGPTPKRVFVTSGEWNGNLGGLDGADNLCRQAAKTAGLGDVEWRAWLSTTTVNAISRIQYAGPYALVNGTVVANSAVELVESTVKVAISITENNTPATIQPAKASVWTSTDAKGQAVTPNTCTDWTSGGYFDWGHAGSLLQTGPAWTDSGTSARCSESAHLYCFEL